MAYRICLYSPDTHVIYDGLTPDVRGIGGGVTARVRMMRSLSRIGHSVCAYVNCVEPGTYDGVAYIPFQTAQKIEADIAIFITTGGQLDLSPAARLSIRARLKIVWVQGHLPIKGLEDIAPDYIYVASNFLREVVTRDWGMPTERVVVFYNGLEQEYFRSLPNIEAERNPFSLVYLGHPSPGLDACIKVLRDLRSRDERFQLDVFGGNELWGQQTAAIEEPGVHVHGLIGQRELISRLPRYNFCLALQDIEEGFGIAVQQAKRAGVVVIASSIGAFKELFINGYDGFLIESPVTSSKCREETVELITNLIQQPEYVSFVRRNALATPWDWDLAAQSWTAHWDIVLHHSSVTNSLRSVARPNYSCPKCRASLLALPDGQHCLTCGRYFPCLDEIQCFADGGAYYGEVTQSEFHQLLGKVSAGPWRQAVASLFATSSPFLYAYILDQSRSYFHFLFDLSPDSVILDLGAGYGTIAAPLTERCRVVALDNTFLRLAFLRERCRQDRLQNLTLVYGDALELPFEPEQFDLITMVGLLEWVGTAHPEPSPEELQRQCLHEAYRVLKSDGCLYIGIENRYGFKYLLGDPDDHTGVANITYLDREEADAKFQALRGKPYRVRTHSHNEYEILLREAGFRKLKFYAPYPDYRFWSVLVPLEPPEIAQFYLDYLQDDLPAGSRAQQVQSLERVASRLGHLNHYVNSYAILAWK
ncbi:MAG: methyltransferase domain-containing protein [Gemmatales bacterium]|nr:methyltransferase domain-containing protein [Gemmatales bacterium]